MTKMGLKMLKYTLSKLKIIISHDKDNYLISSGINGRLYDSCS